MAIWQYTFEIIPKTILDELGVTDQIKSDLYDRCNFWENYGCEIKFFESILFNLNRGKSWSDEIITYGNEESACIKFIMEDNKVANVIVRLDFRNDYSAILNHIINFCYLNSLAILEDLRVIPLNSTIIVDRIENSEQFLLYKILK